MTAQEALKAALRDIVSPAARAAGFKGSGTTLRRTNEEGDWAIVNVQSSSFSDRDQLRCVINVAVAPKPWLEWMEHSLGRMPKAVPENLGLFRDRLHPSGSPEGIDTWWEVGDSAASATAAALDMVQVLERHGWPKLSGLLDRSRFLEQVRSGELGHIRSAFGYAGYFARAEAILLTELGPSEELEQLLQLQIEEWLAQHRESAEEFAEWARRRAAERG